VFIDVGSFVLAETEDEVPAITSIGGDNGSCASALSTAGQGNSFLDHLPAEVSVDQPRLHLGHGPAQIGIGDTGLAHPAAERPCSENPFHDRNHIT
jgi:hypothetical protein